MESLALIVSLMVGNVLFSGPFALLFTLPRIRSLSASFIYLLMRRLIMVAAAFMGISLSILFIVNGVPLTLKVLSLICIATHIWAADREYENFISSRLRRHG
jgi:hypothetical protein